MHPRAALVALLPVAWSAAPAAPTEVEGCVGTAIEDYLDFAEYAGGNLAPEQIPAEDWPRLYVVDTRQAQEYAQGHIPGAHHMEWRTVAARRHELPSDGTVLLYCNTGSLSAQAVLALRLLGHANVRVLTGGYEAWKAKGGFQANARAAGP
jgi:rhodanese-related sulfurtransferase